MNAQNTVSLGEGSYYKDLQRITKKEVNTEKSIPKMNTCI